MPEPSEVIANNCVTNGVARSQGMESDGLAPDETFLFTSESVGEGHAGEYKAFPRRDRHGWP